jgi:murein DD-endopeptidase MepM/ murein hydrolase activator NlpD
MSNIVGEPFDEYVNKQIRDRQKIHGQGLNSNRDKNTLSYLHSKTSWIKLTSGVTIKGDNGTDLKRLNTIGLSDTSLLGTGLAKHFILFNGTSDASGQPYSGINLSDHGILSKVTYGIGGLEQGFRPMPGITSTETKFRNRGSIREGTINIKAFNKAQLEIIDILYLRLGFPMLLEWGHSIIVGANGAVDVNPNYSISNDLLNIKFIKDTEVLKALEEKRISSGGNYDGMWSKVVNFEWTLNKDNSYDVTLKLISVGAVVESFKVNLLTDTSIKEDLGNKKPQDEVEANQGKKWINRYKSTNTIGKIFFEKFPQNVKNNLAKIVSSEDTNYIVLGSEDANLYYVRFGEFLKVLESVLPCDATTFEPLVKMIEVDDTTKEEKPQYMYTEIFQISGDPRICYIGGFSLQGEAPYENIKAEILAEINKYSFKISPPEKSVVLGNINNIYVNAEFILSKLISLQDTETNEVILIDLLKDIVSSINGALGGINSLEVIIDENINTVKIIDSTPVKDDTFQETEKPSEPFVVMGYNESYAGFIKDVSIKTELTNASMAMMTIGATANGAMVGEDATAFSKWNDGLKPIIHETLTYKPLNNNPVPPIKKPKELYDESVKQSEELAESYNYYLTERYTDQTFINGEEVDIEPDQSDTTKEIVTNFLKHVNYLKTLLKKESKDVTPTSTSSKGFLPLNLSMTMDGMSGIKIYQKLQINTNFLPVTYPFILKFIIKGVTNKIDKDGWMTTLETISTPVIKDDVNGGPLGGANQGSGGGSNNNSGDSGGDSGGSSKRINSPYGMRGGRLHNGVDFYATTGTKIFIKKSGVVKDFNSGWFKGSNLPKDQTGWGNYITIDHGNNIKTRYAHLSKVLVTIGEQVENKIIGETGNTGNSTGPHLHWEYELKNRRINKTSEADNYFDLI